MSDLKIAFETGPGGKRLARVEGALTRGSLPELKKEIPAGTAERPVEVDLSGVTGFDTFGAVFLIERAEASGGTFHVRGAPAELKDFVRGLARFGAPETAERSPCFRLERMGEAILDAKRGVLAFCYLGLEFLYWLGVAPFKKGHRLYTERTFSEISAAGVQAIPIVILVSLLMGVILALNSAHQLEMFGATIFVADLVGVALTKELGPVFTAILVAGRSGSAVAAEIGTMVVTEEVDALKVMGINPRAFLVVPKVLSLVVVMPCLVIMADILGICGGLVISMTALNISCADYVHETLGAVATGDVVAGLFKSVVFGLLIGLTGATFGLRLRGGAEEVGRITTASVVVSFLLIIVADTFFTVLFAFLGL